MSKARRAALAAARLIDLTGRRFGRLKVLNLHEHKLKKHAIWRCLCDCGARAYVAGISLRQGWTQSCGCLKREQMGRTDNKFVIHGDTRGGRITPEFAAWANMLYRCNTETSPAYKDYGGRGIKVCRRWKKYANFLADMGRRPSPAHSLDRVDNDGGYKPSNCRWAARDVQGDNRRKFVSDETRRKVSRALTGRKVSAETRRKIAAAHKGRLLSKEHVAALRAAYEGKKGEARRKRMSKLFKGRTFSAATRKRMSESAKRRHRRESSETATT